LISQPRRKGHGRRDTSEPHSRPDVRLADGPPVEGEGLNAYEKYIQDAQKENATACVEMFRKLQEQDARQVVEIRDHLKKVIEHFKM
jgi:hypothetical protein